MRAAMSPQEVMQILAIMLAAGLASSVLADILRLPRMVLLLAAGVMLGPEVFDWLDVPVGSVGVQLLLTLGVSLVTFAISIVMWMKFDAASPEFQFVERHQWLPDFGISYHGYYQPAGCRYCD